MNYEVNKKAESGWVGWQTMFGTVVGGLVGYYTGLPETLTIAIGTFAGATARPVVGYAISWLPKRPGITFVDSDSSVALGVWKEGDDA